MNRNSFPSFANWMLFFSFSFFFFYFYFLFFLPDCLTYNLLFKIKGNNGHPYNDLVIRIKSFCPSSLSLTLAKLSHIYFLSLLEKVPFYSYFFECFYYGKVCQTFLTTLTEVIIRYLLFILAM